MIIRWPSKEKGSKTGKGNGQSAINYLLGANNDREGAELFAGDTNGFVTMCSSLNNQKIKYTSGVLAFKESVTDEQLREITDGFEKRLTAGLINPPEFVWVKHQDKANTELHFLIPNYADGRSWTPYVDWLDRDNFESWQTLINDKHQLSDPLDPANWRLGGEVNPIKIGNKKHSDLSKQLKKTLQMAAANKQVNGGAVDRDFLIGQLDKIFKHSKVGYEIKSDSKKSFSILVDGHNKPIRFSGGIYERDRQTTRDIIDVQQEAIKEYRRDRPKRIKACQAKVKKGIEQRTFRHRKKHKKFQQDYAKNNAETLALDDSIIKPNSIDVIHGELLRANGLAEKLDSMEQVEDRKQNQLTEEYERIEPTRNKRLRRKNQQTREEAFRKAIQKQRQEEARVSRSDELEEVVTKSRAVNKRTGRRIAAFTELDERQRKQIRRIDEFLDKTKPDSSGPANSFRLIAEKLITKINKKIQELRKKSESILKDWKPKSP